MAKEKTTFVYYMSESYNFSLSENQIRHFIQWKRQFTTKGPLAGNFSFKFTPTTIGLIVQILYENDIGLEKEMAILDVTDYDTF